MTGRRFHSPLVRAVPKAMGEDMTNSTPARHPFLDDLTPDAELASTLLRKPVSGRENVKKVVEAVGSFYKSQAPTFFEAAGTRKLLRYGATLGTA
jgi:hypothetical protein